MFPFQKIVVRLFVVVFITSFVAFSLPTGLPAQEDYARRPSSTEDRQAAATAPATTQGTTLPGWVVVVIVIDIVVSVALALALTVVLSVICIRMSGIVRRFDKIMKLRGEVAEMVEEEPEPPAPGS
jgi:hypothetical protein